MSWKHTVTLGIGLAARAGSLGAQTDTTRAKRPAVLPTVEVRGSIVHEIGPIVSASAFARVIVLNARRLDAGRPRLLPTALASLPSISVDDAAGSSRKLELTLRGFAVGPTVGLPAGVTVFVDGVRQNEPDGHQVDFDLLPLSSVTRIEVLAGTAALLGPNSLGGAVNLVTRHGTGPTTADLELTAGSFGSYEGQANLRGQTAGGIDYYGAIGYDRTSGWRRSTASRRYQGLLNVGRVGPTRGIALQIFGGSSRAATAGSLPESEFVRDPRANFTPGDQDDIHGVRAALSGYLPAASGRLALSLAWRETTADRFNVNQAPDPDVLGLTTGSTVALDLDWRTTRALGRGFIGLRAGIDGSQSQVRARIFDRPPGIGAGGSNATDRLATDIESPSTAIAGVVAADYRVGAVSLAAGIRYDVTRVPFHDRLDSSDETSTYRRGSPRAELTYDFGRGMTLFGSVAGSFRSPAILELGCADPGAACPLPFALGEDPPLRPVRATTYETGARGTGRGVTVELGLYRTEVRDEIFFVASPGALLAGYFTNLDRTRREGLTVSLASDGSHRIDWYLNGSLERATFQSPVRLFSIRANSAFHGNPLAGSNAVVSGDRLPLVPSAQLKGGASIDVGRGVGVSADARWVGRQWLRGDEANETAPLRPYFLANATLQWSRGEWKLTAIVENLLGTTRPIFGTFNENRRTGQLERFLTPAAGRDIRLVIDRTIGARRGGGVTRP